MAMVFHLWLPILLSAVLVFVASSVIHMVLKWHNPDYRKLPGEEEVRAAFHAGRPEPGQYVIPYCMDPKDMAKPEIAQRYTEGPVALVWLKAPGMPNLGGTLAGWFLYLLALSFFVAYLAAHTLAPGAHYLHVFRVVGAAAFIAFAAGGIPSSIWMGKPWAVTFKETLDSLIYALLTAGAFGWLWPK
jgi:hypothetical protein